MARITIKDKDSAIILRENGHMDFYVPKDDPVSYHTQMMACIAILYNNDKPFQKMLERKWLDIRKSGVKSKYIKKPKKEK